MSPLGKIRSWLKRQCVYPLGVNEPEEMAYVYAFPYEFVALFPLRFRRRLEKLRFSPVRLPQFSGTIIVIAFLASSALYGASLGGQLTGFVAGLKDGVMRITEDAGMAVSAVYITGLRETNEGDVIAALDIYPSASLLFLNVQESRLRAKKLPWIDDVEVQKLYPNQLKVTIHEREPFAIWQHGKIISIIDDKGRIITDLVPDRYEHLPRVFGQDAPRAAAKLFAALATLSALKDKVKISEFVNGRRWNLHLNNGIVLMLPENNMLPALLEIAQLDEAKGLFNRDISMVDMRLSDRIVVRLTEKGIIRRQAKHRMPHHQDVIPQLSPRERNI